MADLYRVRAHYLSAQQQYDGVTGFQAAAQDYRLYTRAGFALLNRQHVLSLDFEQQPNGKPELKLVAADEQQPAEETTATDSPACTNGKLDGSEKSLPKQI